MVSQDLKMATLTRVYNVYNYYVVNSSIFSWAYRLSIDQSTYSWSTRLLVFKVQICVMIVILRFQSLSCFSLTRTLPLSILHFTDQANWFREDAGYPLGSPWKQWCVVQLCLLLMNSSMKNVFPLLCLGLIPPGSNSTVTDEC